MMHTMNMKRMQRELLESRSIVFAEKTYLSRAISRAFDGPIGDPYGGAAYGEKNDPVSAIAAVASFVVANAGTIALVGTAMSVVGGLTGNKMLSRIGMVVGLVGGAAGLAAEGAFGASAQEWTKELANTAAQNVSSAAGGAQDVITQAAGGAAGTEAAGGAVANIADTELNLAASAAPSVSTSAGDAALNAQMGELSGTISAQNAASATPFGQPAVGGMIGSASTGDAALTSQMQELSGTIAEKNAAADLAGEQFGTSQGGPSGVAGTPPTPGTQKGSVLDRLGSWVDKNKSLTETALKFGQGLFSADDTEARDRLYGAQADMIRQQQQNASAVPDITKMFSVNPNAQINRPATYAQTRRPGGLIQQRTTG